MAIQYKNARFSLTGTAQTTVLTLSVSSRAILQNIQNKSCGHIKGAILQNIKKRPLRAY